MAKREHNDIAIDSESIGNSAAVRIRGTTVITASIVADTGTHSTCNVVLQLSPNGTDWFNHGGTMSGAKDKVTVEANYQQARFRTTVGEGSTSTYLGYIWAT